MIISNSDGIQDLIISKIKLSGSIMLKIRLFQLLWKKISFSIKLSSPKILPLCPSLYFLNIQDEYKPDELGRVFDLIVGAQLVRTGLALFYWRDGQSEVDYVIKKG